MPKANRATKVPSTGHNSIPHCSGTLGHSRPAWFKPEGLKFIVFDRRELITVQTASAFNHALVLRLESTHTIDIEKFVPRSEVDELYLDSPYYLTPQDHVGQEAFAVIREAMARKNMVGLGRVVISRRERIVMLELRDKGLVATTLHYAYEIRNATEYFADIPDMKLPGEMIELAQHILETKAGHFDASEFEDRYENAVVEMLKRKQAGLPPEEQPEAAPPTNVVNLMDALRRSVEAERPAAARGKATERKKPTKGARRAG